MGRKDHSQSRLLERPASVELGRQAHTEEGLGLGSSERGAGLECWALAALWLPLVVRSWWQAHLRKAAS